MPVVNIILSGPVGSAKSALAFEIMGALRAIGVEAEVVGVKSGDVDGDAVRSLEIYRDSLKAIITENLWIESQIEARVAGSYEMGDRPGFWIDAPVAREIARRALAISPSSNERLPAKRGA